jgi:hypothetical protein
MAQQGEGQYDRERGACADLRLAEGQWATPTMDGTLIAACNAMLFSAMWKAGDPLGAKPDSKGSSGGGVLLLACL